MTFRCCWNSCRSKRTPTTRRRREDADLRNPALRADYLPFLLGSRQRVKLSPNDLGPRALVVAGQKAYVANYFSDTLSVIDLGASPLKAESLPLGPKREMDVVRHGEFYFHDANLCYQGWQSCASCHPGDGRADGIDWDLLNDGVGNPKNTKSLLLADRTPPMMWLGVRDTAPTAIRAGIEHILFSHQPDQVADSIYEYLKSLKPLPSPYLERGGLSEAAQRGRKIFARAGCADCHVPGLFTDLKSYDVGTSGFFDRPAPNLDEPAFLRPPPANHKRLATTDCSVCHLSTTAPYVSYAAGLGHGPALAFVTPTLVEVWRTAPYLHDGSAATIREVVTTRNPQDQHGRTSDLSSHEIDDLCAYVLSL